MVSETASFRVAVPEIIKSNDFIKQHQIHILECFAIFCAGAYGRLAVSVVVVRKVSDKPSGKRRKIVKTRALIFRQELAEECGKYFAADGNHIIISGCCYFFTSSTDGNIFMRMSS